MWINVTFAVVWVKVIVYKGYLSHQVPGFCAHFQNFWSIKKLQKFENSGTVPETGTWGLLVSSSRTALRMRPRQWAEGNSKNLVCHNSLGSLGNLLCRYSQLLVLGPGYTAIRTYQTFEIPAAKIAHRNFCTVWLQYLTYRRTRKYRVSKKTTIPTKFFIADPVCFVSFFKGIAKLLASCSSSGTTWTRVCSTVQ